MKTVNDKIMNSLQMFSGTLNDRLYKYFKQSGRSGALPDMLRKAGFRNVNEVADNVRAFRTNSGTTDYVQLASSVTLAGDWSVEFNFARSGTHQGTFISGVSDAQDTLVVDVNSNRIRCFAYGTTGVITPIIQLTEAQTSSALDGKLRTMRVSMQSGTARLYVDGAELGSASWSIASTKVKNVFYRSSVSPRIINDIISDLRITAAGVPIHFWPMNEGSGSTHVDVIGGNNGTIINGQPSDWELFERLPGSNKWVGPDISAISVADMPPEYGGPLFFYWDAVPNSAPLIGNTVRVSAYMDNSMTPGVPGGGWSGSSGIPVEFPFRRNDGTSGAIGGDYIVAAAVDNKIRLFYNSNYGTATFYDISVRRILEIA